MNILLAGFKGKNNSAKILLDLINPKNKVKYKAFVCSYTVFKKYNKH